VVTIDGGRLFFPDERADDLVPHLRAHWAAHAAGYPSTRPSGELSRRRAPHCAA
jgi:hypothetical protein